MKKEEKRKQEVEKTKGWVKLIASKLIKIAGGMLKNWINLTIYF